MKKESTQKLILTMWDSGSVGLQNTTQKIKLSIMLFLVNMSKSVGNCGYGHIYWKIYLMENFVFCAMKEQMHIASTFHREIWHVAMG